MHPRSRPGVAGCIVNVLFVKVVLLFLLQSIVGGEIIFKSLYEYGLRRGIGVGVTPGLR